MTHDEWQRAGRAVWLSCLDVAWARQRREWAALELAKASAKARRQKKKSRDFDKQRIAMKTAQIQLELAA